MRGIRLVIGLALVVAGCESDPQERATAFCTTFCKCQAPPAPDQRAACIDQCVPDFLQVVDQLPAECITCIEGHANQCALVETECDVVCNVDEPPPPPPPVIVDAGV